MMLRVASTASIACFFVSPFSATRAAISAFVTPPPSSLHPARAQSKMGTITNCVPIVKKKLQFFTTK